MSELVEKVARVLCIEDGETNPDRVLQLDTPTVAWSVYTDEARAAIAAVAEWLDPKQIPSLLASAPHEIVAARLRNELEQPK